MKKFKHTKMTYPLRATCATMLLLAAGFNAQSQIAAWDPNGLSAYGPSPWAPTTADANLTVGGLMRGAGVTTTGPAVSNTWGGENWTGAAGHDFSFTITAAPGYTVSIDSIDLSFRRDATGPEQGLLEYSINGSPFTTSYGLGFISILPGGSSIPTLDMTIHSDLQNVPSGSVITFRITPYAGSGSTGPLYIQEDVFAFNDNKGLNVYGSVGLACMFTSGHSVTGITVSDATISWNSIPGVSGYEYVVSSTPIFPSAWIFTATNSVPLSGLDPSTLYYVFVRTVCDTGNVSSFSAFDFTTLTPTGIVSDRDHQNFFSVYPNPVRDVVTLSSHDGLPGRFSVSDMTGKKLLAGETSGTSTVIGTEKLAPGIYTVIYSSDFGTYSCKIVKQ